MNSEFKSEEEIAEEVYKWLMDDSEENREAFISTDEKKLVLYHNSLGRNIRNKFGLWNMKWKPELKNGIDFSPEHPDAISLRIIKIVWSRARKERDIQ